MYEILRLNTCVLVRVCLCLCKEPIVAFVAQRACLVLLPRHPITHPSRAVSKVSPFDFFFKSSTLKSIPQYPCNGLPPRRAHFAFVPLYAEHTFEGTHTQKFVKSSYTVEVGLPALAFKKGSGLHPGVVRILPDAQ